MSSSSPAENLDSVTVEDVEYPEGSACDIDQAGGLKGLNGPVTGRVVMGMDTPGPPEMSIQDMEGKRKLVWDSDTDDEYFNRVREKARDMAKEILARAMTEAEEIKERAAREGYEEGLAHARTENQAQMVAVAQNMESILGGIQAQGTTVYQQQRTDIIGLIRLAAEKTLRVEIEDRRAEILASLLDEALEKIDAGRNMTVICAAQDMELLESLLQQAAEVRPELKQWRLKSGMPEPGGVLIETDEGIVDNGLPSRWQGVEEIFDKLAVSGNPDNPDGEHVPVSPETGNGH